jgi:hypothetical protein
MEMASSFAALPARSAARPSARRRGEDTAATVSRERRRREKSLVTVARLFFPFQNVQFTFKHPRKLEKLPT